MKGKKNNLSIVNNGIYNLIYNKLDKCYSIAVYEKGTYVQNKNF